MKVYKLIFLLFAFAFINPMFAQKNTTSTVVAKNRDISDNLDLQAVASIFGDSKDLEDFEKRLNDPSMQISNLDLNQDGYVDYLRVLEVAEGDTRVIVIQAVLGQDQFQDVATIELEKQRATASSSTNVSIQIVGNPYIYGPNYIYEPYYYTQPVFFDFFWMPTYRPYYSPWYWGYYPTYYSYWAPVPYFRYNRNVYRHINHNNRYVYTDNRRVSRADRMYSNVRGNSLERQNPGRSFEGRNNNVTNRYAFDRERAATRNNVTTDRSGISSNRGSLNTTGRGEASVRSADRSAVNSNTSEVRSTGTRVRSDFNANRGNNSGATRVSVPNTRMESSNSSINRSNVNRASNTVAPSSSRIERTSRANTDSFNRSSNTSSSFNRSSNTGSFNRSSSPAPSRSMSAPSSSSSRGGGSTGRGR